MRSSAEYAPLGHDESSSLDLERSQQERLCEKKDDGVEAHVFPIDALSDLENDEEKLVQGWSWVLLVSGVASATFFYCLDKSITTILIPVIVGELGEAKKLPWVFVGFGLGSLSLTLPIGKIYCIFNAKSLYLGFLAIFMLGSGLCGAAWNMNALIIGRVVAGVGGVGVYTGIMTILTSLTTEKERPVYLGVTGLFWSIGRVIGPLFGGLLGKTSWRWAFYINLLVCGVFVPVYIYILPSLPSKSKIPLRSRVQNLDTLGAALSICTIITLFTSINSGGTRFPWSSPTMIGTCSLAIAFTSLFATQQFFCFKTTAEDRIFPLGMVFNPNALLVFVVGSTSSIAAFVPTNFVSLYFQFTRGDAALDAALRLLPMIIAMTAVMPLSGYLMPKIAHLEWWPVAGTLVALPGFLYMVSLQVGSSPSLIYISEALIGAGMGSFLQLPYTLVGTYVSESQKQEAMTFIIISQVGGIAVSMATSTAIFTNLATLWLQDLLPETDSASIEKLISGTSGSLGDFPSSSVVDVLNILVDAMQPAWIITLVASITGLLAALVLIFTAGKMSRNTVEQES
ncbi:major facilitator superfamily domain-containing protein [Rhexocercosporidium sp. MPI-PUGE-AT-0058]|nr:major facilitator superfamily domain-containing protein [Rhexocercosporidium sp. MPI-PUGE-AT-0058]